MAQLTKEQRQIVEARGCNLLVSAGAGAGKTHTLVQRIIALITGPEAVDVDRLLVVTFTNAAAAEMRQRIGEAIIDQIRKGNNSKHLRRQIRLLNKASISTIHSFCLEIIRQHFHKIDLDPNFRIADELESDLIKDQVVEKLLERYYDSEDNALFLKLVDSYGGQREDTLLCRLIMKIHSFAYSTPFPEKWLDTVAEGFYCDTITSLEGFPWIDFIKDNIKLELEKAKGLMLRALKISEMPGGPKVYSEKLKKEINGIDDVLLSCKGSWEVMEGYFKEWNFEKRLPTCSKKDADAGLKEKCTDARNKAKDIRKKLINTYFSKSQSDFLEDIKRTAPLMKKLMELVKEFAKDFTAAKAARGLVDFNDLEHNTLKILRTSKEASKELQEKFQYILVDEYQDINEVQEALLQFVARKVEDEPNMLMVGDPKQSIYRFRLAEPSLFQSKQQSYSKDEGSKERRIDLSKNFRSRETVIDAVNFIFRQILTKRVGEMDYDKDAELVCGANYPPDSESVDRSVELCIIDKKDDDMISKGYEEDHEDEIEYADIKTSENEEELETSQLEARFIANKIKELIKDKYPIFDKQTKAYRPIQYRDIVILMRATKGWANTFSEEFRLLDIPVYAELSSGYFESVEVNTIMSLLRVIDNPRQDIPLAAILRSPIVGLNAEELASIRLSKKEGDFWEALIIAANDESALGTKLKKFVEKLNNWRTMARRGSLSTLIWEIYRETGYFDYAGGLPGGIQRQANLRALYDRARQYEHLNFRGLSRFLNFIEAFLEKGKDLGEARSMGENENVVRIMSIHKSKGLEFPVVFVAGLGKKFNIREFGDNVLLHKTYGLGPDFVDTEKMVKGTTLAKLAIKEKLKRENLAEEMRILYVALTRAKEKLLLVGTLNDFSKAVEKWTQGMPNDNWRLPDSTLLDAGCFLDWIGTCVARHKSFSKLCGENLTAHNSDHPVYNDPSKWQCQVIKKAELKTNLEAAEDKSCNHIIQKIKNLEPIETDGKDREKVINTLAWKYPYAGAVNMPAVVSVTELKGRILEEEYEQRIYFQAGIKKPAFLQEAKGLSASEYGSVMHTAMQHLNIKNLRNNFKLSAIEDEIKLLVEKEILTTSEAEHVNCGQIYDFFTTELGKRILFADNVKREVIFTRAIPAEEAVQGDTQGLDGEYVLLRGIIDCLIIEDDGILVLDYKTDNIIEEQVDERVEHYRYQLEKYSETIERIMKKPVKEKHLYFFALGKSVKVS